MPAATEQTPLIQTVIVTPTRHRYHHNVLRRFCTIALGSTLVVILILFILPIRWPSGDSSGHSRASMPWSSLPSKTWPASDGITLEEVERILFETPSQEAVRDWSRYYASGPHLAGKNLSQAELTRDKWQEFGIDANIVAYDVYINYPVSHRLALLEKKSPDSGQTALNHEFQVSYECSLEEDVLEEDPTTGLENRVPTFHGYSASGNVTGQFVYVNFGTFADFQDLVDAGIALQGKIALAKYGHCFRGLKVRRAQQLGMIGVVLYSDPQEDGDITELNGYKPYPEGPAKNPSSVQRGSVQFLSK